MATGEGLQKTKSLPTAQAVDADLMVHSRYGFFRKQMPARAGNIPQTWQQISSVDMGMRANRTSSGQSSAIEPGSQRLGIREFVTVVAAVEL